MLPGLAEVHAQLSPNITRLSDSSAIVPLAIACPLFGVITLLLAIVLVYKLSSDHR